MIFYSSIIYPFHFLVLSDGQNVTHNDDTGDYSKCGVNYCPAPATEETSKNLTEEEADKADNFSISKQKLYVLAGVYLACSVLSAIVVSLAVDPLSR